jgi:hypothetical protein
MTGRLLFVALSLPVISALSSAHAADPAFCKQYARAALVQVRGALRNPHCGAGVQGMRWSGEFPVQYEWCLGASLDDAGAERDARTDYLKVCAGR